ncbi:MAG: alpha/beta fold hydrolase [Bryobacterales bacterium]|nr:alpha/beta fold hydrolase [Bryobacterales bacterium]
MRPICLLLTLAILAPAQSTEDPAVTARRKAYLDQLLRVLKPSRIPADGRLNNKDKTWEDWLRRTGELPPDFDSLPSIAGLPDPLLTPAGTAVRTKAEWETQKKHLRSLVSRYIFGDFPPTPDNLRATVIDEKKDGRVTLRFVELNFGPNHRAKLRVELVIPEGKGPFPVFLTNHARNRPWIYTAVRRGYIAAVYHATDPHYFNGDDSDRWVDIWQDIDFPVLARWAWAASRTIDYLVTLPEVDKAKIGLTGHSRNGKMALLAAAFDERIGAVIPSSGNSGECDPWRYTTEPFANESIELLAGVQSHWFSPRLRFFSGREDKLPVDQNTLLALVAPRGLMMYAGYAESAGNPVGFEQAYRDAQRVYKFLGREDNIWLHLRDGEHGTTSGDIENFVDFFDAVFDRKPRAKTETFIHGYTFADWQRTSGELLNPASFPRRNFQAPRTAADRTKARKEIEWVLGEEPPGAPNHQLEHFPLEAQNAGGWLQGMFGRPKSDPPGMKWAQIPFGEGLAADVFTPADAPEGKRLPVVVYLHGYSYQYGWSIADPWKASGADYRLDQRPSFPDLVKAGFAVVTFDQIGFGTRVNDAKEFYRRYPKWSLLGKMVTDTRSLLDAIPNTRNLDPAKVYLMGYSLGAKIGLLTAALDARVTGLAAVGGYDPLALSTKDKGVEGIAHYARIHGLLPRLGFFEGQEDRLPFDFDTALSLVAPRKVLLISGTLDRYARVEDVRRQVETVKSPSLTFETPEDFNRFTRVTQRRVLEWLTSLL